MSSLKDKIIDRYARKLSEQGFKIITKAFENSDYMHDKTQNLHDSYGSCVYYNGRIYKDCMNFMTRKATVGRKNSYTDEVEFGRDEITSFFNNYKANPKGFELVMAVAMFYGKFLEDGAGNLKRKYRVITFMSDEVEDIAKKFHGEVNIIREGVKY